MKLGKDLNLVHVFSITTGAMLGSGLFILPGLAHAQAGPAVLLSYLLAGFLAGIGMLSQAELVSAIPKAGGTYFYVTRSMGAATGTVYGLITLVSLCLKSAFELVGMATFARFIVDIDILTIAVSLCLIFVMFNLIGAKEVGRIQSVLVFSILAILLLYMARGFPCIDVHRFEPFAPQGLESVFSTAGFVFLSYGGLLKIASVAEEVKNPGRILPLGMIFSLLVAVGFFVAVIFVTIGVLDAAELNGSLTPITDAAAKFMSSWGKMALNFAAILAFASAANAGIMGASRYPLALSRDGLLPAFLGKVNARFKTPHFAVLVTGIFVIAALFFELSVVIKAASSVLILTYVFSCVAVIILRESRLQNYQPQFRAPLYPWMQVVGLIGFGALLFEIGMEALLLTVALIVAGFLVYWFYGRVRTEKEHALLHLVERLTAKELTTHSLETELKEIIRERDDIIADRFDSLIEQSVVLDIEKAMSVKAFFQLVADGMAERAGVAPEVLLRLLVEREKTSSTVISASLAIPHIVVEGEQAFAILLARCKEGIVFSEAAPSVHTIFVLVGTAEERNFHLRALAAIAQIVQDRDFEERWMAARSKEALRDIVLLGKRRR